MSDDTRSSERDGEQPTGVNTPRWDLTKIRGRMVLLVSALLLRCALSPTSAAAQSIQGVVVDDAAKPIAGAVLLLLDTTGSVMSRSLSNELGEYRLTVSRTGSYRIRTMRIGFQPSVSQAYALSSASQVVETLRLSSIRFGLDTVRVSVSRTCGGDDNGGAATFALWDQARTAFIATELTGAQRGFTMTTIGYERSLDPTGRRTLRQRTELHSSVAKQPWLSPSPDSLHRAGYVIRDADNAVTYFAPGLDMLLSDVFVADHCFRARTERERVGIDFEPARARRQTAEIAGTVWIDRASAMLERVEFHYVNLPSELEAASGGELEFARLRTGSWAITSWAIRMPIFERRVRSQALGGTDTHVVEMQAQGGELVLARRGRDTIWSQPPRMLHGVVVDSVSGRAIEGARVGIEGTGLTGVTDQKGRFAVTGVLPGEYTIALHSKSLDSVAATYKTSLTFTGEDATLMLRAPSAAQILAATCGERAESSGALFGVVRAVGQSTVPADARVVIEWPLIRDSVGAVVPGRDSVLERITSRIDVDGGFRTCRLPIAKPLVVRVESDSGYASDIEVQIEPSKRYAHADLYIDRSVTLQATLSGVVLMDSSGRGIADAEIAIPALERTTRTDGRGAFSFSPLKAGTHRLLVRRVGYGALDTSITVRPGQTVTRQLFLRRARVLETVTTVASAPPSFDEHRHMGLGSFLTRQELASQEGRKMQDVLAQLRGLRVIQGSGGHGWIGSARRTDCVKGIVCPPDTYFPDNLEARQGVKSRCYANVYLDNTLMNPGAPPPPFDVSTLPVETVEAIEYYAGPSETPNKYSGLNTSCGVLILWTRRSP
jgi:hypothetical protein